MKRIEPKILFFVLWTIGISVCGLPGTAHAFNSMDEIFLHDAVQEQMFILEAAEVAELKSSDKRIKKFAHELFKTVGHLNKAVGRLSTENIPPGARVELPAALSEDQVKRMHELEEADSEEFDAIFLEMMPLAIESLLNVYRREIEYGSAPHIRKFAAKEISTIEDYLMKARQLRER